MNPCAPAFTPGEAAAAAAAVPQDGISRSTWRQRRQSERDANQKEGAQQEACRFFRQGRCTRGAECKYQHPMARARTSRPRRGQAGEAFRKAESFMGTPQLVRTREDLVAALRAAGGDAFRVKVHIVGCDCHRAAPFADAAPGLLAIPDSRGTRTALHVSRGDRDEGDREAVEAELARTLFPSPAVDDVVLKANCAKCVLALEPNGTVAVVGSRDDLRAHREAFGAEKRSGRPQHGDAAHAVASAPIALLRAAFASGGGDGGGALATAQRALHAHLEDMGLARKRAAPRADHHLQTFLNCPSPGDADVFLIAYDDASHWTLELPGGKRNLAESAWAAAQRETAEEALLHLSPEMPDVTFDLSTMRCFVVDAAKPLRQPKGPREAALDARPPAAVPWLTPRPSASAAPQRRARLPASTSPPRPPRPRDDRPPTAPPATIAAAFASMALREEEGAPP